MENWVIKNRKADFDSIVSQCGVSEVIARCLVNKGIDDPTMVQSFLKPDIKSLSSPFLLKDMKLACDILSEKITSGKRIRIIGDYDVDGVISTYILYRTFTELGAKVDYEIPDRIKDGYGINVNIVKAAYDEGIDTIITCDNGIAAIEQIALAKEYKMTVIVTDHHNLVQTEEGGYILPPADAVINPKQPDCEYPFEGLCGAAIAYKLCIALLEKQDLINGNSLGEEILSFTAIATICDVMDLVDENRIIVKYGLEILKRTKNLGLLALIEASGIEKEQLNTFHMGFVIGPCLNASGRLDTAKKGLELLLTESKDKAEHLAEEVRNLNEIRKSMTAENVEKAISQIEETDLKFDKVLVIYLEDCHESIAGIIAGRIREKYNKPTLVLTEADGCIKGSGRSIELYNMFEELSKCRELFLKMGGHPMAAGFSLQKENLDILRKTLNSNTGLTEEMLIPKVTIDIHLPFGYVNEALIRELQQLEPFGKGNEKPLFAEKNIKIKSAIIIGKNASGIRFRLQNQYGKEIDAIYFGDVVRFFDYIGETFGESEVDKLKTGRGMNGEIAITYFPRLNEYNGFKTIQLMIQNYR
jgi:single-stranded-DNA-specific exonuclease RecJ